MEQGLETITTLRNNQSGGAAGILLTAPSPLLNEEPGARANKKTVLKASSVEILLRLY